MPPSRTSPNIFGLYLAFFLIPLSYQKTVASTQTIREWDVRFHSLIPTEGIHFSSCSKHDTQFILPALSIDVRYRTHNRTTGISRLTVRQPKADCENKQILLENENQPRKLKIMDYSQTGCLDMTGLQLYIRVNTKDDSSSPDKFIGTLQNRPSLTHWQEKFIKDETNASLLRISWRVSCGDNLNERYQRLKRDLSTNNTTSNFTSNGNSFNIDSGNSTILENEAAIDSDTINNITGNGTAVLTTDQNMTSMHHDSNTSFSSSTVPSVVNTTEIETMASFTSDAPGSGETPNVFVTGSSEKQGMTKFLPPILPNDISSVEISKEFSKFLNSQRKSTYPVTPSSSVEKSNHNKLDDLNTTESIIAPAAGGEPGVSRDLRNETATVVPTSAHVNLGGDLPKENPVTKAPTSEPVRPGDRPVRPGDRKPPSTKSHTSVKPSIQTTPARSRTSTVMILKETSTPSHPTSAGIRPNETASSKQTTTASGLPDDRTNSTTTTKSSTSVKGSELSKETLSTKVFTTVRPKKTPSTKSGDLPKISPSTKPPPSTTTRGGRIRPGDRIKTTPSTKAPSTKTPSTKAPSSSSARPVQSTPVTKPHVRPGDRTKGSDTTTKKEGSDTTTKKDVIFTAAKPTRPFPETSNEPYIGKTGETSSAGLVNQDPAIVMGDGDSDGPDEATLWPVVMGLVIGIPTIIVIVIAVTVVQKKHFGMPGRNISGGYFERRPPQVPFVSSIPPSQTYTLERPPTDIDV